MNIEPLVYWVKERELIRIKKESGQVLPWTSDPILATFRFCNVRREDDRVTKWVDNSIRKPFADHPHLWFMLCMARMICWPGTLQELIDSCWPHHGWFSTNNVREILNSRRIRGDKVWTAAYLIPSGPNKGEFREVHVCNRIFSPVWDDRSIFNGYIGNPNGASIMGMHKLLSSYNGFGNFLAYQAVVDMRFTRILNRAYDVGNWAAAGPGTIRGLNRIAGRDVDAPVKQSTALLEMRELHPRVVDATGVPMDFSDMPNVLCETDKYVRIKHGEGKMKARFVPGRGY